MLKNSKLDQLLEGLMTRYRLGGFVVGDQIKFVDGIKTSKDIGTFAKPIADLLDSLIERHAAGDIILKVTSINQKPWAQDVPVSEPDSFDISVDEGGGRYFDTVTLPGCCISCVELVENPIAIAPTHTITYPSYTEPEIVPQEDEELTDAHESGAKPFKRPKHPLPEKNTKIPAEVKPDEDYKKGIKGNLLDGDKVKA